MQKLTRFRQLTTGVLRLVLLTFLLPNFVQAQAQYDISTRFFLHDLNKQQAEKPTPDFIAQYDLTTLDGVYFIGALAKVNSTISSSSLRELGVISSTQLNDLWTLRIPLGNVASLLELEGIDFIEIGSKHGPELDRALTSARVDTVHMGLGGLDRAYFGSGVIVAIIDWGFDYTHPNFYDTTLSYMRLTRAWDQNKLSGPAPTGYSFGTEYLGPTELLAAQEDTLYVFGPGSHGTHVAGIAAGSGSGVINYGAAPDAELLFISLRRDAPSLTDAFAYITNYAASVNKPYVVNMSFGSHLGPHDGSSLENYAIDILHGPGKVFVGSAGNNGSNPFHLSHNFAQNPGEVKTVVNFNQSLDNYFGQTLSMWGSAFSSFRATIQLVDNSNNLVWQSPTFNSLDNPFLDQIFEVNGNELHLRAAGIAQQFLNNKPNIRFEVRNTTGLKTVLILESTDSHVHVWNNVRLNNRYTNWGVDLTANFPDAVAGDIHYGLGEPAGVGRNVITVASYQAEQYTTGGNFVNGNLSNFTSRGPTTDERTKPDIASTGQNVLSSVNSFDGTNQTGLIQPVEFNGRTYGFKRFSGTSMSGPMVAGIVALMLEAYPTLSATQAKHILKMTARLDFRTGDIDPEQGTLDWGWGKANALTAILAAKTLSGTPELELTEPFFTVYPNPASDELTVAMENWPGESRATLTLVDLSGKILHEAQIETNQTYVVSLTDYESGIYIVQVSTGKQLAFRKVLKQ
jgi:minor extracellular serine protease Vpr